MEACGRGPGPRLSRLGPGKLSEVVLLLTFQEKQKIVKRRGRKRTIQCIRKCENPSPQTAQCHLQNGERVAKSHADGQVCRVKGSGDLKATGKYCRILANVQIRVPLCLPGWSAVVPSRLTATSASWVHMISLTQPPKFLLLLPRLECNGTLQSPPSQFKQFSCLSLPIEKGFHHVVQAGLKLLTSGDSPTSVSQRAGITGMSQLSWPHIFFIQPIIDGHLALWEVKVGRSRGQEIETILANMVKPVSTKNTKISWVWWHAPVVPATREAEAEEWLEPRRRRLQLLQYWGRSVWLLHVYNLELTPLGVLDLSLSPRLEYSGEISANYSFNLWGSKVGFHHVVQAGLELLTSGDPPTSASQRAGITEMKIQIEVIKRLPRMFGACFQGQLHTQSLHATQASPGSGPGSVLVPLGSLQPPLRGPSAALPPLRARYWGAAAVHPLWLKFLHLEGPAAEPLPAQHTSLHRCPRLASCLPSSEFLSSQRRPLLSAAVKFSLDSVKDL
ncbi:Protein GVQW1 [Plecturocebus cupreus]